MLDLTKRGPGPVMMDVAGTTLDEHDVRRIAHPLTGGVILFARNFESRVQLSLLTHQIRAVRPDIIIAIDQEGGRVQRLRTDGFTVLPPMRALGELWDQDVLGATRAATALGLVLGSELRASGIDLSFAPVLDLDYGRSGAIGDRAFHRDPRVVTLLANGVSHGLALAGMANCGKHFPGHGFVDVDTHVGAASDERSLAEIEAADLQPYRWMGVALASVMAAHVIYPKVDTLPAGFSKIWLKRVLRRELGFGGAIFSDDLSMEGARVAGDVVSGARLALQAGCDMVLVCNRLDLVDRLLETLDHKPSHVSSLRIRRLRARGKPVPWSKLARRSDYQAARATIAEFFSPGAQTPV